ncbi:peptidoglycan-binding domain-containing protein [Roseofilum capinflatum]|uniref:Peptidoglycan-binding domain-containing protein n=1 Tax=Roseofilum capinflatum BLCC-M114 TaxID=3022440 RepID=A0ABT7BBJ0_9CYAN|nr:peptidoglycan-binding protein [Roseofilum capinflatum]MDJ1175881.1 peptidoglycan-binding domain-containing protein [Roseofilum capinflatum BLCC-M114]
MKIQDITDSTTLSPDEIKGDAELVKEIQEILVYRFFLLEPPVDGKFGPLSRAAFQEFQKITDCSNVGTLDFQTAQALLHTPRKQLVQLHLSDDIPSRIVAYMLQEGYHISLGKERYNIVYVEGMNTDGTLNDDAPDRFNDLRCLIEIVDGCPRFAGKWVGTCEPGRHYTTLINGKTRFGQIGAARIKFGQYRAWKVGKHSGYEALVNRWPIPVYRDVNEDMLRTGDPLETTTGINQHHAHGKTGSIGPHSAGCLVGRTVEGHREFMKLIKSDDRYQASHSYRFMTTIIPGDELLETPIHPYGHEDDLSQITWIDIFQDSQDKLVIVGMNEGTAIRKWMPKDKAEFLEILQSCYQANTVLIASADKPIPEL